MRAGGNGHDLAMRDRGRGGSLLLLASLLVSGCSLGSGQVRDEDLKARGQWTEADEQARRILNDMGGAWRPVRLPTVEEKLTRVGLGPDGIELGAVSTLLGLDFEPRYYYSDKERSYVLLSRGHAPVIVPDGDGPRRSREEEKRAVRESDIAAELGAKHCLRVDLPPPPPSVVRRADEGP